MTAGTLTLTNKSDSVTGTGTAFGTELSVGDFVVATVGGIPYTLPVKSIESDTALTLVSKYTGPTQSGAGWNAVPRVAMNLVTAAVVTQAAEALRGLNYDKQNWQLLFSATGDITVRLPDGSTFTGPSWNSLDSALDSLDSALDSLNSALDSKAAKGTNSDITSLTGLTTALTLEQGGTGASTAKDALASLGVIYSRSGVNSSVIKIGDIYQMDFLTSGGTAIGEFNPSVIGGVTYYTHYYKLPLPVTLQNGVMVCNATLVGDTFENQNPGYNADVKVSRDLGGGGGLLRSYVVVSVKTPFIGWIPFFNVHVIGY